MSWKSGHDWRIQDWLGWWDSSKALKNIVCMQSLFNIWNLHGETKNYVTSHLTSVPPFPLCESPLSPAHSLPLILAPILPAFSLSQSIASCRFSSLRDTQHFSGRSGSWLRQGEAIKTTADWNRLREQQCKLKGAHVVEQGVNSNRLAPWNKETHTSHPHGDRKPYASAVDCVCVCVREAFTESVRFNNFR